MIKIKMLTSSAGPEGTIQAGQITSVTESEAKSLVEGDFAEYVDPIIEDLDSSGDNEEDSPLKHVGGGYYELPNGEKIRGKGKALEAFKALEAGGADGNQTDNSTNGDDSIIGGDENVSQD